MIVNIRSNNDLKPFRSDINCTYLVAYFYRQIEHIAMSVRRNCILPNILSVYRQTHARPATNPYPIGSVSCSVTPVGILLSADALNIEVIVIPKHLLSQLQLTI